MAKVYELNSDKELNGDFGMADHDNDSDNDKNITYLEKSTTNTKEEEE